MKWGLPWPGRERAAQAEDAGATAFCAGEFSDLNAYITSTEMALGTSKAMLGPGIAYAFARSPFVHAASVRHLSKHAPGRVFLGLGAGTPRMNRDWFGVDADHPAPRMAELIEAIRAYLRRRERRNRPLPRRFLHYRGRYPGSGPWPARGTDSDRRIQQDDAARRRPFGRRRPRPWPVHRSLVGRGGRSGARRAAPNRTAGTPARCGGGAG